MWKGAGSDDLLAFFSEQERPCSTKQETESTPSSPQKPDTTLRLLSNSSSHNVGLETGTMGSVV